MPRMIEVGRSGKRDADIMGVIAEFPPPWAVLLDLEQPCGVEFARIQHGERYMTTRGPCAGGDDRVAGPGIVAGQLLIEGGEQLPHRRIMPTAFPQPFVLALQQMPCGDIRRTAKRRTKLTRPTGYRFNADRRGTTVRDGDIDTEACPITLVSGSRAARKFIRDLDLKLRVGASFRNHQAVHLPRLITQNLMARIPAIPTNRGVGETIVGDPVTGAGQQYLGDRQVGLPPEIHAGHTQTGHVNRLILRVGELELYMWVAPRDDMLHSNAFRCVASNAELLRSASITFSSFCDRTIARNRYHDKSDMKQSIDLLKYKSLNPLWTLC